MEFCRFDLEKQINERQALFLECFPETIGTSVQTKEHYIWKFHSYPESPKSYEYIAKIDENIVGYYASIPYTYNYFSKKVKVAMVCDVMTGIKARGKGVFTKLGTYSTDQFKNENIAFSTGYPIRKEVMPGHKKVGWEFPFDIPIYSKAIKLDSLLRNKKKAYLIPIGKVIMLLQRIYLSSLYTIKHIINTDIFVESYAVSDLSRINGFDDFLVKWQTEYNICLDKGKEYLFWRLGAPERKYRILILRHNNNTIVGYAVITNTEKENVQCLGIVDFSVLNDFSKYVYLLLKEIDGYAKNSQSQIILVMMMKHYSKKMKILKYGYFKTPYKFSFIVKKYIKDIDDVLLSNENNWCLMWIDSDNL